MDGAAVMSIAHLLEFTAVAGACVVTTDDISTTLSIVGTLEIHAVLREPPRRSTTMGGVADVSTCHGWTICFVGASRAGTTG